MIKITKSEREALERVGLFRHKKTGYDACDPSFYIANKEHVGRNKHTYIVEEPEVMRFLGKYDGLNLQRINDKQLDSLQKAGFVTEQNTQKWGEYVPGAICFEGPYGDYRIVKMTSMMLHLGLWKDNKRKRMAKQSAKEAATAEVEVNVGFDPAVGSGVVTPSEEATKGSVTTKISDDEFNKQVEALGRPDFVFRDVETGEIVGHGSKEDLQRLFGSLAQAQN